MKGPIFLAGICERCGKTLLRKILNIHPEVSLAPAETKFMSQMWSRRSLAGPLLDSNLPKEVESYLNYSVLKMDKRKKLLEDLMQTEHMFLNMVIKLASMEELYYLTEM